MGVWAEGILRETSAPEKATEGISGRSRSLAKLMIAPIFALAGMLLNPLSPQPASATPTGSLARHHGLRLAMPDAIDSPLPEALEDDAAALLEEAEGDIEKAQKSYIGYTLAYLEEAMPELYRTLKADASHPDAHAALVEVTWDAIAAFMPVTHSSKPTPAAAQRLTAVARAALPADGLASVLDLGCGNGVLLPFLLACGLPSSQYRGIDMSSRMVSLAQHAHGGQAGAEFVDSSFADECDARAGDGRRFDSIVLNGALQFFADQPATIAAAAKLLSDAPDARIVVSHISGASFVRKEFADNPATVQNTMPYLEMMQGIAQQNGLQVGWLWINRS